jgi:hypothetical protein
MHASLACVRHVFLHHECIPCTASAHHECIPCRPCVSASSVTRDAYVHHAMQHVYTVLVARFWLIPACMYEYHGCNAWICTCAHMQNQCVLVGSIHRFCHVCMHILLYIFHSHTHTVDVCMVHT